MRENDRILCSISTSALEPAALASSALHRAYYTHLEFDSRVEPRKGKRTTRGSRASRRALRSAPASLRLPRAAPTPMGELLPRPRPRAQQGTGHCSCTSCWPPPARPWAARPARPGGGSLAGVTHDVSGARCFQDVVQARSTAKGVHVAKREV